MVNVLAIVNVRGSVLLVKDVLAVLVLRMHLIVVIHANVKVNAVHALNANARGNPLCSMV